MSKPSSKYRGAIAVTQKHIDSGMPEQSSRCMVAEAIKEKFPQATRVHVDMQTIRFTDEKGVRRTYLTPASAQQALVRFDAGDDVRPFGFRLPHIVHISKAINASKARVEVTRDVKPRARVGGRALPILGNSTRRKFGIRNLRINEHGEVVQTGTHDET